MPAAWSIRRPLAAICGLLLLSACSHPYDWPREGRGGMAERDGWSDEDLAETADAIDAARAGRTARPGRIRIAEDRLIAAERETEGGLLVDADENAMEASIAIGGGRQAHVSDRASCLKQPCR